MRRLLRVHKTHTALAGVLGVTQSAVSQVLSEHNRPSFNLAQAVAKAEGVEVMALLDGAAHVERVRTAGAA